MSRDRVFVVGDSHSTFWNGQNSFRSTDRALAGIDIFHMGPVTAQNLHRANDHVANQRLIEAIALKTDNPGAIITCFGEIDCRVHVVPTALERRKPIPKITAEIARNYTAFLIALGERCQCPIVIWAPPPSHRDEAGINRSFPRVGSLVERNFGTFHLIAQLRKLTANLPNVRVCSLFESLIDPAGKTLPGAFYDGQHLSNVYLTVAAELVKAALSEMLAEHLHPCFNRKWLVANESHLRNVAVGLYPKASTNQVKPTAIPAGKPAADIIITDVEPEPWLNITLDSGYLVEAVEYEFGDSPDAAAMSVSATLNGKSHFDALQVERVSDSTLRFCFENPQVVTNIKLQGRGERSLRLRNLRVFAPSFSSST